MHIIMTATNALGRIFQGDQLVIDIGAEANKGQIVICGPDKRLEYYDPEFEWLVIGKVVRIYSDPPPKSNDVSFVPTPQTSQQQERTNHLGKLA